MSNLIELIRQRRAELGLKISDLVSQTKIKLPTLHKYLSGTRPMPPDKKDLIRDILFAGDLEGAKEFDEAYLQDKRSRTPSLFSARLDAPDTTIRMVSLDFWPFAGEVPKDEEFTEADPERGRSQQAFMEHFIQRAMNLAVVGLKKVEPSRRRVGGAAPFDMNQRIESLENDDAEFLLNLMSLQRLKKLTFIPFPIRISVNGVVLLQPGGISEPANRRRMAQAWGVLVRGEQPPEGRFRVVTIANEIGHVFMEHERGFRPRGGAGGPGLCCLEPKGTLDPRYLAEALRTTGQESGEPAMLVCDEHTAIAVLGELKKDAALILPPNSDAAIIQNVERRLLPAFFFGVGMRRRNNAVLIEYLRQTFTTYLAVESESIAEWYRDLYYNLVRYLRRRLAHAGIYTGGVLPTNHRPNDTPPPEADAQEWKLARETMLGQNAIAAARKTLTLSRRSLANLPKDMAVWRPILERARELILVHDGGDRARIRRLLFCCARMAMGRDPYGTDRDSIELLRALVPRNPPTITPDHDDTPMTSIDGYWNEFVALLELELDLDLKSLHDFRGRWFKESRDLGHLISRIQALLESSEDSRLVLTIRDFNAEYDLRAYTGLRREQAGGVGVTEEALRAEIGLRNPFVRRIMAFRLGEPAGFLDAEFLPPADGLAPDRLTDTEYAPDKQKPERSGIILLRRIHVAEHLHGGGISRRLIRRLIEEGNETMQRGIWIDAPSADYRKKLQRAGFTPIGNDRLWFEFRIK